MLNIYQQAPIDGFHTIYFQKKQSGIFTRLEKFIQTSEAFGQYTVYSTQLTANKLTVIDL